MDSSKFPQIKICGLTDPAQAKACAEMGADAIGMVFYPKSPRNVTMDQAAEITAVLPDHVAAVGVFVDPALNTVHDIIEQCGLHTAQLHGNESPEFVADLRKVSAARIIKALFTEKQPRLTAADQYAVDGYLVECGKGRLPGGNAMTWNWAMAKEFADRYPLVLAGGLTPDNVSHAIADCRPDAVDASSGLEVTAGKKDLKKVKQFIDQVHQAASFYTTPNRPPRAILTISDNRGENYASKDIH